MKTVFAALLQLFFVINGERPYRDEDYASSLVHEEDDFRAPDFDFSRLKVSKL